MKLENTERAYWGGGGGGIVYAYPPLSLSLFFLSLFLFKKIVPREEGEIKEKSKGKYK